MSIRATDQELLDQLVTGGEARSVSAAFRLICDAYRTMQAERTLDEVVRRIDHDRVLREVGMADQATADHATAGVAADGPRWSVLATSDRTGGR